MFFVVVTRLKLKMLLIFSLKRTSNMASTWLLLTLARGKILSDKGCQYLCAVAFTWLGTLYFSTKRPFARSDHVVRNKLCWDATFQPKGSRAERYEFLCFVITSALFAFQHTIYYSLPCDRNVQRAYWRFLECYNDNVINSGLIHIALIVNMYAIAKLGSEIGLLQDKSDGRYHIGSF